MNTFVTNPDVGDAARQHGLHHTAVFLDVPVLECECAEHSDVNMAESSCREGGEVYFLVSARGLVPWFVYEIEIIWSLESEQLTHTWKSFVKSETDSYTLREPRGGTRLSLLSCGPRVMLTRHERRGM